MKKLMIILLTCVIFSIAAVPVFAGTTTNLSKLPKSTAMEKKAYNSLKNIDSLAKKYGWTVKRWYTREKLSAENAKKWVTTKVELRGKSWRVVFRHCMYKNGTVYYQQTGSDGKTKKIFDFETA